MTAALTSALQAKPQEEQTYSAWLLREFLSIHPQANLWRLRYGSWQPEDVKAVQATAMVLAEKFNSAAGSHDAALRMVMDMVERAEGEDGESSTP